jgi:hypothetical protein
MTDEQGPFVSGRGGARLGAGRKPDAEKTDAYLLMVKARAQKEVLAAKKADLELKQISGALISVDEVIRVVDQAARACKEHLLGISGRYADVFAAESDARKIERILDREIRDALQHIVDAGFHGYGN